MSGAFLVAVAGILIASGVAHLVRFERSRAAVADQHVVPAGLAGSLVAVLVALEVILGGGTLVAVLTGSSARSAWGLLCAALCVAFGVYAHVAWLRRTHRDVLCACGVGEAPLGLWVTVRSGLLAALSLGGAAFASSGAPWLDRAFFEQTVLICASLSLAVAVTLLPATRAPLRALDSEAVR